MWSAENNGTWVLLFRRELRVWENNLLDDLVQRLQEVNLNPNKSDELVWRGQWMEGSQSNLPMGSGSLLCISKTIFWVIFGKIWLQAKWKFLHCWLSKEEY